MVILQLEHYLAIQFFIRQVLLNLKQKFKITVYKVLKICYNKYKITKETTKNPKISHRIVESQKGETMRVRDTPYTKT